MGETVTITTSSCVNHHIGIPNNAVIRSIRSRSVIHCSIACKLTENCRSIFYQEDESDRIVCLLSNIDTLCNQFHYVGLFSNLAFVSK